MSRYMSRTRYPGRVSFVRVPRTGPCIDLRWPRIPIGQVQSTHLSCRFLCARWCHLRTSSNHVSHSLRSFLLRSVKSFVHQLRYIVVPSFAQTAGDCALLPHIPHWPLPARSFQPSGIPHACPPPLAVSASTSPSARAAPQPSLRPFCASGTNAPTHRRSQAPAMKLPHTRTAYPSLLLAAVSLVSAQLLTNGNSQLPSCATGCQNLINAAEACGGTTTANQQIWSCFCQSAYLKTLYTSATGVCDSVCTNPTDNQQVMTWYTSNCGTDDGASEHVDVTTVIITTTSASAGATLAVSSSAAALPTTTASGGTDDPADSTSDDKGWWGAHYVRILLKYL